MYEMLEVCLLGKIRKNINLSSAELAQKVVKLITPNRNKLHFINFLTERWIMICRVVLHS